MYNFSNPFITVSITVVRMSSLDFHLTSLDKSCRVCGEYQSHKCAKYQHILRDAGLKNKVLCAFGVNVINDDPNIHPQKICNNCYSKCLKGINNHG